MSDSFDCNPESRNKDLSPWRMDACAKPYDNLFSSQLPITDDDAFFARFGGDPSVLLPDELLDRRWWKKTGQELYSKALRAAELKHRQLVEEYQALVASVDKENKEIDVENERRRKHALQQHEKEFSACLSAESAKHDNYVEKHTYWHHRSLLRPHSEYITLALLWLIHKRSLFSPAALILMAFTIIAGVLRLYLTAAIVLPIWNQQ